MKGIPTGTIFVPLRVCSQFYSSRESLTQLRNLLKKLIMIHDEIAFEQDMYLLYVLESGSVFETHVPSRFRSGEFTSELLLDEPDLSISFQVGKDDGSEPMTIMKGKLSHHLELDFYPLLKEAGIAEEPYVHWFSVNPNDSEKREVDKLAGELNNRYGEDLKGVLPNDSFRVKTIRNTVLTSRFAAAYGIPFASDRLSAIIAQEYVKFAGGVMSPEVISSAYTLMQFPLPSFDELTWDQLLELRQSGAGIEYRRMVRRVSDELIPSLGEWNESDMREQVQKAFNAELMAEMCRYRRDSKVTGFDIGLNIVSMLPYIGAIIGPISTLKQLGQFAHQKNSWLSIFDYPGA